MKLTAAFLLLNTLRFSTASNKKCDTIILSKLYAFAHLEELKYQESLESRTAILIEMVPTNDVNVISTWALFIQNLNKPLKYIHLVERRINPPVADKRSKKRAREQGDSAMVKPAFKKSILNYRSEDNIPPAMTPIENKKQFRRSSRRSTNAKRFTSTILACGIEQIVEKVKEALLKKMPIYYMSLRDESRTKHLLDYPTDRMKETPGILLNEAPIIQTHKRTYQDMSDQTSPTLFSDIVAEQNEQPTIFHWN